MEDKINLGNTIFQLNPKNESSIYVGMAVYSIIYIIGLIVNIKLLRINKNEGGKSGSHLVQQVMATFTKIQIIIWPIILVVATLFSYGIIFPDVFDWHICFAYSFMSKLFRFYLGFNSLAMASMRYIFILHQERVTKYGKEKTRKIFLILSLVIPLAIVTLHEGSMGAHLHWRPVYYKCLQIYGYFETGNEYYNNTNSVDAFYNLPIHNTFDSMFPDAVIFVLKYFSLTVLILTVSNVVEGFLYLKTFLYIRR